MKYNPLILLLCGVQTHYHSHRGFPDSAVIKNPPANAEDTRDAGSVPGLEDPLEKEMATHSSILAWKIPWTEESGW